LSRDDQLDADREEFENSLADPTSLSRAPTCNSSQMLFVFQTDDGMAIESHLTAEARAGDQKRPIGFENSLE
jgi:hypothetical protein